MFIVALGFICIDCLAVVIGLLSTMNIFGMAPSNNIREHADITDERVQRGNARIMLVGLALLAVGFLLMWAGGA